MKRFKNILFFADRVDGLEEALDKALALSQSNNARLTVMDVTPEAGLADIVELTYSVDINRQMREQRLQELEELTSQFTGNNIPVLTKVVSGTPFIEIIRAVQRNEYDLLIKLAQPNPGFAPWLFGSTDMHLLRKCPCPVWIIREQNTSGYKRILAAVDPFDETSLDLPKLILDLATSLARQEHAELEVVHAWELLGESMLTHGRARMPQEELELLLEQTEKRHQKDLESLLKPYASSISPGNVNIIKGRPSEIISKLADKLNVDLIIMGTVGRIGIPGMFIGNTAEDVLRSTRASVLAVKPNGFISPVS